MSLSPASFAFIQRLLAEHSAIVLDPHKKYLVVARLRPVARDAGCSSIDELVQRVRTASEPALRQQIIDAMTTNETSFYRDGVPFERLRAEILPDLIQRRVAARQLQIWSAGCAGGQEIYSVALLIRAHFPQLQDWNVHLLGTDVSTEMLQKARAGRYTQSEVERGLPGDLLRRFFRWNNARWELDESVRAMVQFRQLNLHGDWPGLPAMDVVLLRNVLVYFDLATKRQVLRRVRQVLRPDGYLLLGGAESVVHVDDTFTAVRSNGFSYYRLK